MCAGMPLYPPQGGSDPETKQTVSGEPDHRFKEHGGGQHGNQVGRGCSRVRDKLCYTDAHLLFACA